MFLSKAKIATTILLTVSLLVGGAGVVTHQALADKPNQSKTAVSLALGENALALAEEDKEPFTVNGRVLGPDAMPLANARLYLPRRLKGGAQGQEDIVVIQRGTTGKDGRFTLKLPRRDVQPGRSVTLIAAADGFGIDWVDLPQSDPPGEVTFHLVKDMPIRGRILSTEGKPIAGVTMEVTTIVVPGRLDEFLKALQREWRAAETMMTKQMTLPVSNVLHVAPSDKDGRFEVAGIGAERLVGLQLTHATLAKSDVLVIISESIDLQRINQAFAKLSSRQERGGGRDVPMLRGPVFEHVAEPGQVIEGTIREAGTGKPVTGATIQVTGNTGIRAAVSDARGNYRIVGLRKSPHYTLRIRPPVNLPLIGSEAVVSDTRARLEPLRTDLELARAEMVTGRVLDKATRQGVESFVQFVPLQDNKFAGKIRREQALTTFTDADGQFCLGTIPGPGVLLAQVTGTRETINSVRVNPYPVNRYKEAEFDAADRKRLQSTNSLPDPHSFIAAAGGRTSLQFFNACKVVDIKEGNKTASCDLIVDPGQTLIVDVEDAEGKPLTGAIVSGVAAIPLAAISLKSAVCTVYALEPNEPRQLVLLHPERELAGVITLRGDGKDPLRVRLGRSSVITGRLLDQDSQPIPGANVAALYAGQVGSDLARELRRRYELPRTDEEGRFRLTGIVPGLQLDLGFAKGAQRLKPETRLEIKPLEAGKILDLGDVRVKMQQ